MSLSDRRLLIELGAVLVIKILLITVIKIQFFSPDTAQQPTPAEHFLRASEQAKERNPEHPYKER